MARNLLNVKVKAETAGTGSNGTEVDSGSNSTTAGGSPPPVDALAAGRAKNNSAENSVPAGNGTLARPPPQDASAGEETKSAPAHGGTCTEHGSPVIASLAANGGDDEDGEQQVWIGVGNVRVDVRGSGWILMEWCWCKCRRPRLHVACGEWWWQGGAGGGHQDVKRIESRSGGSEAEERRATAGEWDGWAVWRLCVGHGSGHEERGCKGAGVRRMVESEGDGIGCR